MVHQAISMMIPKPFFLLAIAVTYVSAGQRCCEQIGCHSDDYPFDHLPLPQCLDKIQPIFSLYTNKHPDVGAWMTPDSIPWYFNKDTRTVLLIHGFRSHAQSSSIQALKDGFLKRGNFNVIAVSWKRGADTLDYPQAASNTRSVAMAAANMLEGLMSQTGLQTKDIHCVGHSLGAHACGFIGKFLKLGRISGLDPAGPWFSSYSKDAGLSKDDADFVDVIHTMGKDGLILDLGMLKPLGHIDFYPNGGKIQPGCINFYNLTEEEIPETYGDFGCSHSRAHAYFIESLMSDCVFRATQACGDPFKIPESCIPIAFRPVMGVDAGDYDYMKGLYYLETNDKAPFCKSSDF